MADDPTNPTGSGQDIDIIKPPVRGANLDSLADFQSAAYRAALQGQQLQRQHRTVLAQLGTALLPNDVSNATIPPAAGGYTQADIQVMVNELAALKQVVAQLVVNAAFQKQTLVDNIKTLT